MTRSQPVYQPVPAAAPATAQLAAEAYPACLQQWQEVLSTALPHLSQPEARVLALWSWSTVMLRTCSLSAVSLWLSELLGQSENTWRARLRELCYEAGAKRGAKRRTLEVEGCFAPLLKCLLSTWQGQQLALAVDASSLQDRFVVLCVSVLYRGSAIPVAWKVLPAGHKGAWQGHWLRLLRGLAPAVPRDWCVLVLADRGLYAKWLFRRIVRLGWHPLLRINGGGTFQVQGAPEPEPLSMVAARLEGCGAVRGHAFKGAARLACTLGVFGDKEHRAAWLVLTDLAPAQCQACWYGLRAWIEHGFKQSKREGWQWQRTRMQHAERAERMWLVLALATLCAVNLGSVAEDACQKAGAPEAAPPGRRVRTRRVSSVFRRGWVVLLVAAVRGLGLALGGLHPEPWPALPLLALCFHDTS